MTIEFDNDISMIPFNLAETEVYDGPKISEHIIWYAQ